MELLPAPPPHDRLPEAGQLGPTWTMVFWVGWTGITAGFAAIWYSSRTLGLSTWWLGPESAPRIILISLLPFAAPLALAVMGLLRRPYLPVLGVLGALITALVAVGDVGRVNGYAAVEFLLAGGGLLVSVASFAGMWRRPEPGGR